MSSHETRKGSAGPAKRVPDTEPLADRPDRLDREELDRRDAAKSTKRRPPGPPEEEGVPADDTTLPDVPPTPVDG